MFPTPVRNIQSLVLEGEIKLPRNSKLMLNEIFPELRKLTLNSVSVPDPSVFYVKFPHLKHLKIAYPKLPLNEPSEAMKNLFMKNSQIVNVEVVCCSPNYHRMAVDYLGSLETFDATYLPTHVRDKKSQSKSKSKHVHFNI